MYAMNGVYFDSNESDKMVVISSEAADGHIKSCTSAPILSATCGTERNASNVVLPTLIENGCHRLTNGRLTNGIKSIIFYIYVVSLVVRIVKI